MQPCLPKTESRGSQGFEALNPGIRETGKRKQSKECWWKLPSMQWAGVHLSWPKVWISCTKGTLQVIACELCRAKGKHECCKTHYTAALCFRADVAIKAMLTALNFESHSICFRSQKEVSIYSVPHPYLIKALHGDFRRMEHIAHTSKFYIGSEGSALNQVEKNLCWHARALYYKTYTFIV